MLPILLRRDFRFLRGTLLFQPLLLTEVPRSSASASAPSWVEMQTLGCLSESTIPWNPQGHIWEMPEEKPSILWMLW